MKRAGTLQRKMRRDTRGSALVEFTLILPLAMGLMAGGTDIGMAFLSDATVGKSVRNAARYLGTLAPQQTVACSSWAIANAKNLAVYGKTNPGTNDKPLIANWQTDGGLSNQVTVDCAGYPSISVSGVAPYTSLILHTIVPTTAATFSLSATHVEISIGG